MPACDLCGNLAAYDAATANGWKFLCHADWLTHGTLKATRDADPTTVHLTYGYRRPA